MPKPKRHHYIPLFYLDGFSREGLLWVYDRARNEFRRQQPKDTAVIGHYYAFTNVEGETDYGLESDLSKYEGWGQQAIAKVDAGGELRGDERMNLAYFIALLFTRTPKAEREADDIADAFTKMTLKEMFPTIEAINAHFASTGESRSYSAEDFYNFIHDEKYRVVGNRNTAIDLMLRQTPEIARSLAVMNWEYVHTVDDHLFLTSDSPFALLLTNEQRSSPAPVGVGSPDVTKAIPLTKRTALVIRGIGLGARHVHATKGLVRAINIGVATECEGYIFGADEAHVRGVVRRSKVASANAGSRLVVEQFKHPTDNRSLVITRRVSAEGATLPFRVEFPDDPHDS